MKDHFIIRVFYNLIATMLCCCGLVSADTVPPGITYQGRLTDSGNVPAADGTGYEIEVRIWNAASGGSLLWGARYTGVPVKNGAFNLVLGAAGGAPLAGAATVNPKEAFNGPAAFLGLTVTKDGSGSAVAVSGEISPRQQLFASPYAFRAEVAAKTDGDAILSPSIKDGEVKSADIGTGEVKTDDIADGAVTSVKIGSGVIVPGNIAQESITPDRMARDFAIVVDEKPQGTNGGVSQSFAWSQRTLNKVSASGGNSISLANNLITLKAGTYLVEGRAPAYNVARHCVALRKSATQAVVLRGSSEHCAGGNGTQSFLSGILTVTSASEEFEVWHYTERAISPDGLGVGSDAPGTAEIFTTIEITRIK